MIKSCTTGHNEVVWEHGNHPSGCPVCSQIAMLKRARESEASDYMGMASRFDDKIAECNNIACKLRDANIEIERLKMCFHQQESFGDIHLKMCREKDVEIVKLKESRVRLESQLKAAWDRSLSLKSIGPLEKSEVDVMKDDYFAMKKQRDELLVENEMLKHPLYTAGSAVGGEAMYLKQRVFALDTKIERLNKYNTELNAQNQQLRRDIRLIERAEEHGITKKMLDDMTNWARGYGAQG